MIIAKNMNYYRMVHMDTSYDKGKVHLRFLWD